MFLIDHTSKDPIFIQIQNQILKFIEAGVLSPGDRLPSVRQLAQDNGINPNTVARAYSQLEQAGYVYNMPKKGVYVRDDIQTGDALMKKAETMVRQMKQEGISREMIVHAVGVVYGKEVENAGN